MNRWIPQGLIGVIHLPALPGDPLHDGRSVEQIIDFAMIDAEALVQGGVHGVIIENFGSAPFPKGTIAQSVPAIHLAVITLVASQFRQKYPNTPLGINILRNDAFSALSIAKVCGANFIRVNILTGTYVTDQGVIEGPAYELLRMRKAIDASHIAIMADVLVKHATPLAPLSPKDAALDTIERGLADALIVTGSGTGQPVDRKVLEDISHAANGKPVFIGSGAKASSMPLYANFINGAIVGTSLKIDGHIENHVDPDRVRSMSEAIQQLVK